MNREEIEKIIAKYRKKAEANYGNDKHYYYNRIADHIEDNFDLFEECDFYESEEDLLNDFETVESEIDAQWDAMYPEGNDDD